jgi:hypothetical protein
MLIFRRLYIYFDMSTQEGGEEIRTSDLHFIKRGPSRLNYLLETSGAYTKLSTLVL